MNYLLSIDGGATSTKFGIIELESGKIIKENVINDPLNYFSIENGNYKNTLDKILEDSKKYKIDTTIMGIAGVDTNKERDEVEEKISGYPDNRISGEVIENLKKLYILNDIELVLHNYANGDKKKNRIAIIAGTGSNCTGINQEGEKAKAGGLDYILSDEGSGYWIGYKALKAVVKSNDGRAEKTELEKEILNKLKIKNISSLKHLVYSDKFQKKDYAKLSVNVVKCALKKKDKVCLNILNQAGKELYYHVKAVAKELEMKDFTVIEAGSIFKINFVKNKFEELVKKEFKKADFLTPNKPSYYGGYYFVRTKEQRSIRA